MSSNRTETLTAARRYATAIFALAVDAKKEAATVEEFGVLAQAITDNENLRAALSNPLISRREKAAVLEALAAKASPLVRRSVAVIGAEGRGEILPAIAQDLQARLSAAKGEVEAVVTSAHPLSPAIKKQLSDALAEATGKSVQLTLTENPDVLGGLLIQLGSLRLDATLAGALTTMRSELLASAQTI